MPRPHPLSLFESVAPRYGELGYLRLAAQRLVQFGAEGTAGTQPKRIADVGCGTGEATRALARAFAGGAVTGYDFSPAMLAQARAFATHATTAHTAHPIAWAEADAAALPLPSASLDLLCSAATLVFLPDMAAALREWRRVLRPRGHLLLSSFVSGMLGPLPALWASDCARFGLRPSGPPLGRLPDAAALHTLLREQGYGEVSVRLEPLAYSYPSVQARLNEITAGLEGAPLPSLPVHEQTALLALHEKHLFALLEQNPQALRVPVSLLLARAWA